MPAKSKQPKYGYKKCEECGIDIPLKIKRDLVRKRFCSRKCLGKFTGKNRSEEFLKNMREIGNTPEINAKKGSKGEKHPNYKKDRSKIKSKRPAFENKEWTKSVFERDDYTCRHCGIRGGKLQADHIKPYCLCSEDEKWDLDNGRTLCVECHKKTDTYGIKMVHLLNRGALK